MVSRNKNWHEHRFGCGTELGMFRDSDPRSARGDRRADGQESAVEWPVRSWISILKVMGAMEDLELWKEVL